MPQRFPIVGSILAGAILAQATCGQDAVRSFGSRSFATDLFAAPAARIHVSGPVLTMLRTDGRWFCSGGSGAVSVPPAPLGLAYVDVQIPAAQYPYGLALLSNGALIQLGAPHVTLGTPPAPAPGTTFVAISASSAYSVGLRSDGVAVAWGSSTWPAVTLPVIPAGATVLQVHASYYAALLRLSNGQIVASGLQSMTAVPVLPAGVTYSQMWAGDGFAVAERSDGTYVAWGANTHGELNLPALPVGMTWVTMGISGACGVALRSDGALIGWGDNTHGQSAPPTVPPGLSVLEIDSGSRFSTVRLSNGSVMAFGDLTELIAPATNPGERWQQVAAQYYGLVLLSSLGRVEPWPANPSFVVPPLPPSTTYVRISCGAQHVAGLRSDGRAVAWGNNQYGQCAIPALPPGMVYVDVCAGSSRTILRRSDGALVECGNNGIATIPALPAGVYYTRFDVSAGLGLDGNSILLRSDGAVTIVTASSSSFPSTMPALPSGLEWIDVAIGQSFAAALRSDGAVVVVGYPMSIPLPSLPTGVAYVQIDADSGMLLARRSDGSVAMARGSGASITSPPEPWPGESVIDITAGYFDSAVRIGPTSTYTSYAQGCAGTRPASRLVPRDTPAIGLTHRITVLDLPDNLALLTFGWNRTAPTSLAAIGMSGCFAHVTVDASFVLVGTAGVARIDMPIPNVSALIGVAFTNQAIVFDAAANAAGLVVSDAAEGVIGRR